MRLSKLFYAMVIVTLFMCNVDCLNATQPTNVTEPVTQEAADPLVGKTAPDFKLPSHLGGEIALKDLLGKKAVVLAFYPKDFTGG